MTSVVTRSTDELRAPGAPRTILVAHNFYQQPGGEDSVFAAETALLRARGHQVIEYTEDNQKIDGLNPLALGLNTVWSRRSRRTMAALLAHHRPDVLHLHNTFPLMSPVVYYAAHEAGVPVVQTLHNYRLVCPNALLFRDGRICEECLGKAAPWPCVVHRCYRRSLAASGATAAMLSVHRVLHTWTRMVDVYVVPTEFARRTMIRGGLPAEKLLVKSHFIDPDPEVGPHDGGFALFVGRLSPEKGVGTLLDAWRRLGGRVPLRIAGDGPLSGPVADAARRDPSITWVGRKSGAEVVALMGQAALLVVTSACYETFGRVVIEAFARGTPVIASDLGAVPELISGRGAGLLFRAGDTGDLAERVDALWNRPTDLTAMGRAARGEYAAKFTAERNYRRLMEIYDAAMTTAACRR